MSSASGTIRRASASQVSSEEWQLWRRFSLMRRRLHQELERSLQRDSAISLPDFEVLSSLFEAPGRRLRVMELCDILGWEKSRLSHQLTRMENRGLLGRLDCATDARGTWVTITAEGSRTILGAIREHASAVRRLFFDVLDDGQRADLDAIVGRVLTAIDPTEPITRS